MQPPSDSALLHQFAERKSDEAFAALVARHVNLVYSVARRQLGNAHNAEEVTQAVFVILAKKAGDLRHAQALSSWLFQTTQLTASNLVRAEIRRRKREEEAHMQSLLNETAAEAWRKMAPLLDSAVAALGEKDRWAILARFYEGRSLREVGDILSVSEDAAEKRVARAVEKLRKFFGRHNVTSTAAVIAALSNDCVQAAPPTLAQSATALAATHGAVIPISTSTLIQGAMKVMAIKKATMVGGGIAVMLLIGTVALTPSARTALERLPAKIATGISGQPDKAVLMKQMGALKLSVWPALMKYANEHRGEFPKRHGGVAAVPAAGTGRLG
jgi:RNA polymerase sigma factor (sigma-70 family)